MTENEHRLAAAVSVDDVRAIMAAVIKKAQGGDVAAAKFVLDRADNDARIAACDEDDWAELLGGKKKSDVAGSPVEKSAKIPHTSSSG